MMKRLLNLYISYSRTERMGLTVLLALMLVLAVAWQTMEYWVPEPAADKDGELQLRLAWNEFRNRHQPVDDRGPADAAVPSTPATLFAFDPNTLDSAGFVRLGLAPRVVKGLMNWRRHGKKFYKKEDFQPLYNLPAETYERLAPYISIAAHQSAYPDRFPRAAPLPATLDLNSTDSATLVRLNGIGPTLAHKIILRRKALGGYLNHDQLLEVYKFSDSTLTMLKEKLVIRPGSVTKISVNKATEEQLQGHPYIGEKYARNIVLYRNALKRFDNIQQLRQVPLMNEENYRKIAAYLVIE